MRPHVKKGINDAFVLFCLPFLGLPLQSPYTTAKARGWTRANIARGKRSRKSVTLSSLRWLGLTQTSSLPQTTSRIPPVLLCAFHKKAPDRSKKLTSKDVLMPIELFCKRRVIITSKPLFLDLLPPELATKLWSPRMSIPRSILSAC